MENSTVHVFTTIKKWYIPQTVELHTLHGLIVGYVNYISQYSFLKMQII